jgi:hypothetical protein
MGISKHLQARLARLEAKVEALPDLEAELEWKTPLELHFLTWATRGSFEDILEKDRCPIMWKGAEIRGPLSLGLVWEGFEPGREELLASGVDFTLAAALSGSIVSAPEYGAPGPDTPRKL